MQRSCSLQCGGTASVDWPSTRYNVHGNTQQEHVARQVAQGEHLFSHRAHKLPRVRQRQHAVGVDSVPPTVVSDVPDKTIVVGGGPCGLTAAISLADIGYRNIEVWDSRARPEPSDNEYWGCSDRSYNVGLVERGQLVVRQMGIWDSIKGSATPLTERRQWSPQEPEGKVTEYEWDTKLKLETVVLQRDRLVSCMLEHIDRKYATKINVKHQRGLAGMSVEDDGAVSLKWQTTTETGSPDVNGAQQLEEAVADFVVGADGAGTTVVNSLEEQSLGKVRNIKLEELPKNTRLYKTVMLLSPEGQDDSTVTYSERSAGGRVLESLPTVEGRSVALVLFKQDDEEVLEISTEQEAEEFLAREFPNTFNLISPSEMKAFAERPPGKLPEFRYVGPELHYSNSVVLVGDAVHTVKPYFGLGLNCAIEDVVVMRRHLEKHPDNRGKALQQYSKERSWDAKVLVEESWRADQGFIYFVLPAIMDRIFNKLAPWLFERSMFSLMAKAHMRIAHVRWRKRLDRVMQCTLIGSAVAIALKLLWVGLRKAFKVAFGA